MEIAGSLFMYPKKRYGQHFLVDKNILRKIISVADIGKGEDVLEIGPGLGHLTQALLERGANVKAIEVDPSLAKELRRRFCGTKNLELIEADALRVSFLELSERYGKKFKVVSNLPYNISGPILVKFMEERDAFSGLFLMLQKEVAQRLTARPGTKDYGILSVFTKAYAEAKREFDVSSQSFRPKPKVTSTFVSLKIGGGARIKKEEEGFFKKVVKSAFGKRRKTLFNALKSLGMESGELEKALKSCDIDPKRRGETLSLEEFVKLTGCLLRPGAGAGGEGGAGGISET